MGNFLNLQVKKVVAQLSSFIYFVIKSLLNIFSLAQF